MGNITSEQADEMKRRVIANGGSVGTPPACSLPLRPDQEAALVEMARAAKRELLGDEKPFKPKGVKKMNKTEGEQYAVLKARYDKVVFEGVRLKLAPGVFYTPDFYCTRLEIARYEGDRLRIVFCEVKGPYIRPDAWLKLKLAAALYPEFTFILAQRTRSKGGISWSEKVIDQNQQGDSPCPIPAKK